MKKAKCAADVMWFEDIPNVGPRIANDFKKLGLSSPKELKGKRALKLYQKLCALTKSRQDPCVLDTFMAAVDFMNGGKTKPWWSFTAARKKKYPDV